MQWQAVACSAIGTKHINKETPCQDAGRYEIISGDQIIIGAVSDGMGSARHSQIGSDLAVKTALSQMKSIRGWQRQPKNKEEAKDIFDSVLGRVKVELKKQAEKGGFSLEDLACTLLVFVATPTWLAAMQIGDGLIVVRAKSGNYELLFIPDKGEFANETTPVTSSDAQREMKVDVKSGCYEFICAATDGIENISLVRQEGWKPFERFFQPLEEQIMLSPNPLPHKEREIDDFLNSEAVNQKTDDDKTLLLCVYSNFATTQKLVTQKEALPYELANREVTTASKDEASSIPQSTVNPSLTEREIINRELATIKAGIVSNSVSQGITPELKIEKSCLFCDFISHEELRDKKKLSELIRKQFIESQIFRRLQVNQIQVSNYPTNNPNYYWVEKINLGGLPDWLFDMVIVIGIVLGMTIISSFIQTLLPSFLGILIYFIFNLTVILFVWFFRNKRD